MDARPTALALLLWLAQPVAADEADAPSTLVGEHPGIVDWSEAMAASTSATMDWNSAVRKAGAAKGAAKGISRPICPYPQYAKYRGSGNTDSAESFVCVR